MNTIAGTQPSLFGQDLRTDQLQLFNAMGDKRKAKQTPAPSLVETIADELSEKRIVALRGQSRLF